MNNMILKEARKSAGLKQKEVAALIGCSEAVYGFYEQGRCKIPSGRAEKLKELFDIHEEAVNLENENNDEENDRYTPDKNDEGYPDPTASQAIKRSKILKITPVVGKIYEILSDNPNSNRAILIMSVGDEFVTGCMVYSRPWKCNYPDMTFSTGRFIIDISEIRRFSIKSIDTHRSCDLPQCWKDYNTIKSKLSTRLGLQTSLEKIIEVEKPVEKIVEKIVEVPAPTNQLKDAVFMVYNDMMNRLGR